MFWSVLFFLFAINAHAQDTVDLSEWKPKLEWAGDLRYRLADAKEDIDDKRSYQQLRARLGLKADVNSDVQAHIRLATGTSAISTNQTMGDSKDPGMARRSFGLDLAYMDWRFAPSGRVWLGRSANPFWSPAKVQTLFDSDLAFEGFALKWEPRWSQSSAFLNAGAFMISENYASPDDVVDTGLVGAELGYSHQTPIGQFTGRWGTFNYANIQDKLITTVEKDAKIDLYSNPYDRHRGNTVYLLDGKYYFQNKYVLQTLGIEWKLKLSPVELTAFFESVQNTDINSKNRASEQGLSLKWGRTTLSGATIVKQSDSMLAMFTDSDANGGGTDTKGLRLSFLYQLGKNSSFAYTDFQAKRGVDSRERNFRSTQIDFMVNF